MANIYDETASSQTEADNSVDTHEPPTVDAGTLKTEAEITAGNRLCSLLNFFPQMEKAPFQMISRCLMGQMQFD